MILISIGFIGLGIAFASKMEDTQGFSLIMQFVLFPIFLLSGAFFPVKNFPNFLRFIAYLNPLTYGVDGLRGSLINVSQFPLILNFAVLLTFGLLMIAIASWLFSKTEV